MLSRQWGRHRGSALVEVLMAVLIGTGILAAATGLYVLQVRIHTQLDSSLHRLGVAAMAFQLLSADVRAARGNPCRQGVTLHRDHMTAQSGWWAMLEGWSAGLRGYGGEEALPGVGFGAGSSQRVRGTDALELHNGLVDAHPLRVYAPEAGYFQLKSGFPDFLPGELLVACSLSSALIFPARRVNGPDVSAPGPLDIDGEQGAGAMLSRYRPLRWYIAHNPAGRRSLYQQRIENGVVTGYEMIEGVSGLTLEYLLDTASGFVSTAQVAGRWAQVRAVRVGLMLDGVQADQGGSGHRVQFTVALRNELPVR